MPKKNKDSDKDNSLAQKWVNKLPEGFLDSAESMQTEDLKKELVKCEKVISTTEKDMENDEKLKEAKELVKDLSGAYRDLLGCQKAKIKAIVMILENRGV